jgi:hypothetical protein
VAAKRLRHSDNPTDLTQDAQKPANLPKSCGRNDTTGMLHSRSGIKALEL